MVCLVKSGILQLRVSTDLKGEAVILPANVPHALSAVKKFKMLLIMIRS